MNKPQKRRHTRDMTMTKQHPETGETLYLTEVPENQLEDLMDPGWRWVNASGSISLWPEDGEKLPEPSWLDDGPTL